MIIMREQVLLARSVFTPTASLIQQVASCLHIINTREMARYKQKEYQADSTDSSLGDSAVKNDEVSKALTLTKLLFSSQPNPASVSFSANLKALGISSRPIIPLPHGVPQVQSDSIWIKEDSQLWW